MPSIARPRPSVIKEASAAARAAENNERRLWGAHRAAQREAKVAHDAAKREAYATYSAAEREARAAESAAEREAWAAESAAEREAMYAERALQDPTKRNAPRSAAQALESYYASRKKREAGGLSRGGAAMQAARAAFDAAKREAYAARDAALQDVKDPSDSHVEWMEAHSAARDAGNAAYAAGMEALWAAAGRKPFIVSQAPMYDVDRDVWVRGGPPEGLETIILVHTNRVGAQYSLPQCPGCNHYVQLCDQVLAEGEGRNDKPHEQGVKTWPDGARYEGEFADDKLHGQGVYTWPDGTRYEGEWRDDTMHGQGVKTWPDGTRYEGEFADDKLHGQGVYTWPDGTRYEGEWRNGDKWNGVETAPDGRTFRFIGGVLVDN